MTDTPDINARIIEEFRANGGAVSGSRDGAVFLLLHHRGARTGTERVSPLAYQPLADGWAVFAAHAGAAKTPDWFHNVVAHPETIVEIGRETVPVRARVAEGDERDRIWSRQAAFYPRFERYQKMAGREIPVVILERLTARRPESRRLDLA